MKYKVHVYTVCWNEMDNLPFVVDYWKRYAEKVIVYDNGSDDGSVEYLERFPFVEVRHFDTDGLDDMANSYIKNNCWKESIGKADFVVVSDLDECLYSPALEDELDYMKNNGITVCAPEQYALQGDSYPKYEEGKLLHEIITRVRPQKSNHTPGYDFSGKFMLFNPNEVKDMNYGVGCHTARPVGNIRFYDKNNIFCIHINRGFGIEYNINRTRILEKRNSENNKKSGFGIHYTFQDEEIRSNYLSCIERSVDIRDILNRHMNNKMVIYTCITGGYEFPTDGFNRKDGYEYVLFSDVPIQTKSWKNVVLTYNDGEQYPEVKKQRYVKTHPHKMLSGCDIAVWVDANTDIDERLYGYIEKFKNNPVTFKRHPDRDCIYEEAMAVVEAGKETRENSLSIIDRYLKEGYPVHHGLFETNVIISHINDAIVQVIFERWWDEILKHSHRDQLSLNYVIWKHGLDDFVSSVYTEEFHPKFHIKPKIQ